jgi:hypothetical protein
MASGKKASTAIGAGALTITGDKQASKRLRRIFSRKHMLGRAKEAVPTISGL